MGLDLPCPDHTTLSRRIRTVGVRTQVGNLPDGPVSFIVDSTGLKVCGQGERHSEKYRGKRRKRWKKLHVDVEESGWILASKVTEGHEQDPSQVPDLLDQTDREIDRFVGDGIYDQEPVYEFVQQHSPEAVVIVPPRKGAVLFDDSTGVFSQRNRHIAEILSKGLSRWRKESGYYCQSQAENVFSRSERIIGERLRANNHEAQGREAAIGCAILNRMREMGRPLSYAVR